MKKHRLVWGYLLALIALICCTAFLPFAAASADEPEGSAPVAVVEDVAEQTDPAIDGASGQGEGSTPVLNSAVEDESTEGDGVAGENADVPATDGEVAAEQSDPAGDDVVSDVPATENNEEVVADAGNDAPATGTADDATADDELLPVLPVVDADDMVDIQEVVIEAEKPAARAKRTNSQDVTSPLATADAIATEFTQELKDTIKNRMKYSLLDLSKNGPQTLNGSTVNVWKIDLDDLKISKELSSRTFLDLLQEAVRESPDLFYVRTNKITPFSYSTGTYAFLYVYANYEISAIPAMQASYEQQVQNALSWVPNNATELQKVQAIHDYLASTCTYDHEAAASVEEGDALIESGLISSYNAYGALVNKTAVCQGYSAAFNALMSKLGVESDYVTQGVTGQGRHGWNRVRIGGDWYNLDVTWDEDVPATHRYFLKSDGYWTTTGTDSRGFHAWWDEDTTAGTNTQYDNKTDWVPYTGPATQTSVTSFALDPSVCGLKVGESANIAITNISPSSACTYGAKWTSSDPSIAAVDATGKVIAGQTAGSTTVTCTINGVSRTCTVNVGLSDNDISTATISAIPDQKFCATAIKPAFTVTHKGVQLTENTDYTVTYSNNYMPGTATITVKGAGSYTGSVKTTFIITKLNVAEDVRIGNVYSETYTGSAIEQPYLGLFFGTNYQLTKDTHYTVKYENNVNAGTATIRITGIGDLAEGETTTTFTINPRSITAYGVSITGIETKEYTGSGVTQNPTITYNEMTLVEDTDYTLSYTNNVNVGSSAKVTIIGIGNYTGSTTKTFSITKRSITATTISGVVDKEYTGSAVTQTPTIVYNGMTLVENTDYTLSYSNNTGKGTATMTVTGKGNFTGSTEKTFCITGPNIADATIGNVAAQTYTGSEITPKPLVTYNGSTLQENTDYRIEYSNNVNPGTATMKYIGMGNYEGNVSKTFTINKANISLASISTLPSYTYDGQYKTPEPTVTYGGKTLVKDTDYTLAYSNNYNAGEATLTVTGNGNFTGSVSKGFTINPRDIATATFDPISDRKYQQGEPITPYVSVTATLSDGTKMWLSNYSDFDTEFSNNTSVGTATVKITGKGNWTGTNSTTFRILEVVYAKRIYAGNSLYSTMNPSWSSARSLYASLDPYEADDSTLEWATFSTSIGSLSSSGEFVANNKVGIEKTTVSVRGEGGKTISKDVYVGTSGGSISDSSFDSKLYFRSGYDEQTFVAIYSALQDYEYDGKPHGIGAEYNESVYIRQTLKAADGYSQTMHYSVWLTPEEWMAEYGGQEAYLEQYYHVKTTLPTDNVNAGTKAITVTGVWKDGSFAEGTGYGLTGTRSFTYKINPRTLQDAWVSTPVNQTYDGTAKTPPVTVNDAELGGLVKDKDYTVSYKDNVNVGTATVTITGKGNYTGTVTRTFKINGVPVTSVSLGGKGGMTTGSSQKLDLDVKPDNATNKAVTWKSSNTAIATVDANGKVTAIKAGEVTITATAKDGSGKSDKFTILIKDPPVAVTSVKVTGSASMTAGGNQTLKAAIAPSNATNKAVTWKSSDAAVATVDANGKVTAKKAGTVTITATAKDGSKKAGSIKITVKPKAVPVTSVKVAGNATMNPGQSQTLKATVAPSNATNKAVTWKSSNTNLATIDTNGKVTAKKAGKVTFTATAKDGSKKAGTFTVTIRTPSVSYRTHVQMEGWQGYVKDGAMSGTSGKAYRLEGINIKLTNVNGGITYRTHVQNIGWQGWKSNGAMSGTSGMAYRLEAIQIKLTGEISKYYDVYYRVHCQNIGWMGWAKNGEQSGTAGYAYRLEGIQIVVMPKGQKPGATVAGIKQATNECFRER